MNGGDVINFNMSAMLVIVHFYKESYKYYNTMCSECCVSSYLRPEARQSGEEITQPSCRYL